MAESPQFRPAEILATLARHKVEYVLIGGLAATLHGAAYVTFDLDITPRDNLANLQRLSDALKELGAKVRLTDRPEEPGLEFDHSGESLGRARIWNLITTAGALDICMTPAGTGGYDDLRRDALTIELYGSQVSLASLADVVRSKEAAGRDKDRLSLPMLRRLLEEQRRT